MLLIWWWFREVLNWNLLVGRGSHSIRQPLDDSLAFMYLVATRIIFKLSIFNKSNFKHFKFQFNTISSQFKFNSHETPLTKLCKIHVKLKITSIPFCFFNQASYICISCFLLHFIILSNIFNLIQQCSSSENKEFSNIPHV